LLHNVHFHVPTGRHAMPRAERNDGRRMQLDGELHAAVGTSSDVSLIERRGPTDKADSARRR
jgi:hypothetical protein